MQIERDNASFEAELSSLMDIERQARQSNDMDLSHSTALKIFHLLKAHGDLDKLASTVTIVCNKRGQFNKTVSELVQQCMAMVEEIKDVKQKIAFVEAIKNICEKKIYLEVEFARAAMILVKYNEKDGKNLIEASKIIENVQVETYGSMSKYEKVEFILYQMKLNILLKDNTKLFIVSKKINPKMLEEEGFAPLKIAFYLYSFRHYFLAKDYASCASCLAKAHEAFLLATPEQIKNLDQLVHSLFGPMLDKSRLAEAVLSFKCLESFSKTKLEEMKEMRPKFETYLLENEGLRALVDSFLSKELTSCDTSTYKIKSISVFNKPFENYEELLTTLRHQLIRKNLYAASLYYQNVRLPRLSTLFAANINEIEDELCALIVEEKISARIDRPAKVVQFLSGSSAGEQVDKWVQNVNDIVDLVDFVCERIEREEKTPAN